MFTLDIITFGMAWWLGLYVFARNPGKPLLRRSGGGLIAYAVALAFALLSRVAPDQGRAVLFAQFHWALVFFPALLWTGALIQLLPDEVPLRARLDQVWRYGLLPITLLDLAFAANTGQLVTDIGGSLHAGSGYALLVALVLLPMLGGLVLVWHNRQTIRGPRAIGLLGVATLFFGLGTGLLIVPLSWLPHQWAILSLGFDIVLLGIAIALLDAFDEGETLLPDMVRSFVAAGLVALLFGGLVGLTASVGTGLTFAMLALLLAVIAVAIVLQVLADPFQKLLDRLVFARAPQLQQVRAELRESANALPRVASEPGLAELDMAEFSRLTRRALGHYGDLARLATNPLTRLPQIDARLAVHAAPDHPLERAAELKTLLFESIVRLKPRDGGDFGTSDAWRYYNALYFPYVVGLKPYSRRTNQDHTDPIVQQALEWFGTAVPERTLHNWQNTAAKLVAQDIRSASQLESTDLRAARPQNNTSRPSLAIQPPGQKNTQV